jgi:hypothetical protein
VVWEPRVFGGTLAQNEMGVNKKTNSFELVFTGGVGAPSTRGNPQHKMGVNKKARLLRDRLWVVWEGIEPIHICNV